MVSLCRRRPTLILRPEKARIPVPWRIFVALAMQTYASAAGAETGRPDEWSTSLPPQGSGCWGSANAFAPGLT